MISLREKLEEGKMVGVLIVSHGGFAEALISSLQFLVGKQQKIIGVSIWPKDQEKEIKGS